MNCKWWVQKYHISYRPRCWTFLKFSLKEPKCVIGSQMNSCSYFYSYKNSCKVIDRQMDKKNMDGFIFVDFEISFFTSLILQSSRKKFLANYSQLHCKLSISVLSQQAAWSQSVSAVHFDMIWLFHLAPLFKFLILRLFTSNSIT